MALNSYKPYAIAHMKRIDNPDHPGRPSYQVTANIPAGSLIFTEEPIVRLPKDTCSSVTQITEVVAALPQIKSRAFDEVCTFITPHDRNRASKEHASTWSTLNDTQMEILACRQGYLRDGCICAKAGFIDVNYTPNCAGSWNEKFELFTVHALHDIPAGTRLFMSHANLDCCSTATQLYLISRHTDRACICQRCSDPAYGVAFWETKRLAVDLERLLREAVEFGEGRDWDGCWTLVETLVRVQKGFGITWELGWALDLAVRYCWALFLPNKALAYLADFLTIQETLLGRDNPKLLQTQSFLSILEEIVTHQQTFADVQRQIHHDELQQQGTQLTPAKLWMKDGWNLGRRLWCAEKEVVREKRLRRDGAEERVMALEEEIGRWKGEKADVLGAGKWGGKVDLVLQLD